MRAFMSEQNLDSRDRFCPETEASLVSQSLAEAQRILAETEPKPIELHRHVKVGATAYVYEDEAQAALIEALTQWLSSDDGQE